ATGGAVAAALADLPVEPAVARQHLAKPVDRRRLDRGRRARRHAVRRRLLAHTVTGLPYVVLTVSASLSNLDPRLEQAARGLGASIGQTLRHVIVPNV